MEFTNEDQKELDNLLEIQNDSAFSQDDFERMLELELKKYRMENQTKSALTVYHLGK
jgi:hypothetical protein